MFLWVLELDRVTFLLQHHILLGFVLKKVSAGNGHNIYSFFLIILIAGIIILSSSLNLSIVSQCGFNPSTANFEFSLLFFYKIVNF